MKKVVIGAVAPPFKDKMKLFATPVGSFWFCPDTTLFEIVPYVIVTEIGLVPLTYNNTIEYEIDIETLNIEIDIENIINNLKQKKLT